MARKTYYPINLDLQGKQCLVVGGGDVAGRKALDLLACGASVTVVSLELKQVMAGLLRAKKIVYIKDKYQKKCLKGVFLVIAATDDLKVNTLVAAHAERSNLLVNVVDVPELCNFIVPSVLRRGPLVMAISTSGQSPVFAQQLRHKCEKCVTPQTGDFIQMMGHLRKEVQAVYDTLPKRKAVYQQMINSSAMKLIEEGKAAEAKKVLVKIIQKDK